MMSEALKTIKKEKNGTVKINTIFSEFWALGMLPKWFSSMNPQKNFTFWFFYKFYALLKFFLKSPLSATNIKFAFLKLEVWFFQTILLLYMWSTSENFRLIWQAKRPLKIGKVGGYTWKYPFVTNGLIKHTTCLCLDNLICGGGPKFKTLIENRHTTIIN
jgi:hypothetical protein